jgi:hypothetical protein
MAGNNVPCDPLGQAFVVGPTWSFIYSGDGARGAMQGTARTEVAGDEDVAPDVLIDPEQEEPPDPPDRGGP